MPFRIKSIASSTFRGFSYPYVYNVQSCYAIGAKQSVFEMMYNERNLSSQNSPLLANASFISKRCLFGQNRSLLAPLTFLTTRLLKLQINYSPSTLQTQANDVKEEKMYTRNSPSIIKFFSYWSFSAKTDPFQDFHTSPITRNTALAFADKESAGNDQKEVI